MRPWDCSKAVVENAYQGCMYVCLYYICLYVCMCMWVCMYSMYVCTEAGRGAVAVTVFRGDGLWYVGGEPPTVPKAYIL